MKNGKLSEVIAGAIATQKKLTKRKKKGKRKKSMKWISTIRKCSRGRAKCSYPDTQRR